MENLTCDLCGVHHSETLLCLEADKYLCPHCSEQFYDDWVPQKYGEWSYEEYLYDDSYTAEYFAHPELRFFG